MNGRVFSLRSQGLAFRLEMLSECSTVSALSHQGGLDLWAKKRAAIHCNIDC